MVYLLLLECVSVGFSYHKIDHFISNLLKHFDWHQIFLALGNVGRLILFCCILSRFRLHHAQLCDFCFGTNWRSSNCPSSSRNVLPFCLTSASAVSWLSHMVYLLIFFISTLLISSRIISRRSHEYCIHLMKIIIIFLNNWNHFVDSVMRSRNTNFSVKINSNNSCCSC